MFAGWYLCDMKGERFRMPEPFVDLLSGEPVVLYRLSGCLGALSRSEWMRLEERISRLGDDVRVLAFRRHFFAPAEEVDVPSDGWVTIPPGLRSAAEIDDRVVVLGMGCGFEVWALEKFSALEGLDEDLGSWSEERLRETLARQDLARADPLRRYYRSCLQESALGGKDRG